MEFLLIYGKIPDYPASLCSLQGIKIHFREFLYDKCVAMQHVEQKTRRVYETEAKTPFQRILELPDTEVPWPESGQPEAATRSPAKPGPRSAGAGMRPNSPSCPLRRATAL